MAISRLPAHGEPGHVEPRNIAQFKLPESFVEKYKTITPPFGFDGLGYFVYKRTYSRIKEDGTNEEWWETVRRVVEGTFSLQKRHITQQGLGWNNRKGIFHAKEMYDRMFNMKFLPPGRGLWAMGSEITEVRGLYAALNNCAFVSTDSLDVDITKPFEFLMDMSMLGVGVGFDTKGAGKLRIHKPVVINNIMQDEGSYYEPEHCKLVPNGNVPVYVISDDREGWVESLRILLESYFVEGRIRVEFDYSEIRPAGLLIKGFGGVSSGPKPLQDLHENLRQLLDAKAGAYISARTITDIQNLIGVAVVAGNVRRTAEIAFGEHDDESFLHLKNYKLNPDRAAYGWASNNSLFAKVGMNYSTAAKLSATNGEPGYAWLENMQKYGRIIDGVNWKDKRAKGGNPCLEQTLESYELCCLVETDPGRHDSLEDFQQTLKYAYMYAKTITLGMTHWPETNRVMLRNRRIGTSVTGVAQFADVHGIEELRIWLDEGYKEIQKYDEIYSDWFAVPRSIKTTSVKPSGTVSKVMGVWAGMHRPNSRYVRRRINVAKNSPLLEPLRNAGYHVEQSVYDKNSFVVSFPVDYGPGRTNGEVTIWEQVSFAAFLQKWWADNQVSCTVSFDPETESGQIEHVLNVFQYDLKGISFLKRDNAVYEQLPEESITEAEYMQMKGQLRNLNLSSVDENAAVVERFCDGDTCTI